MTFRMELKYMYYNIIIMASIWKLVWDPNKEAWHNFYTRKIIFSLM